LRRRLSNHRGREKSQKAKRCVEHDVHLMRRRIGVRDAFATRNSCMETGRLDWVKFKRLVY
jgi:hypothetical protein